MARRKLSARGRYLLAGVAVIFTLCMIAGGIVSHDADAVVVAETADSHKHTDAATVLNGAQAVQDLHKRTGSGSSPERQGGLLELPSRNRGTASGASSPDAVNQPKTPPSDLVGSSLPSFGSDEALSRTGDRDDVRAEHSPDSGAERGTMVKHYRDIGASWKPFFSILTQQLPKYILSAIPPANKPTDYGYLRSEAVVRTPGQLVPAMEWLESNDMKLTEIHAAREKYPVVTWDYKYGSSTKSIEEGSHPASNSPEFPASDAVYRMVTLVGGRLLIAHSVKDPERPNGATEPSEGRLSDSQVTPMKYASDLWHFEWRAASGKRLGADGKPAKPADLHYLMYPIDLKLDKATIDVFHWAAKKANNDHDQVLHFPGHVFHPDSDMGTVLLGTPFGVNVARLLVQHKSTYGNNRAIVNFRFWRDQTSEDEDPMFSAMITLSSFGGYSPVVTHARDAGPKSPAHSSASEIGSRLEIKFGPGPAGGQARAGNQGQGGNQGQAGPQAQAAAGGQHPAQRRPAMFQIGGSSSDSS